MASEDALQSGASPTASAPFRLSVRTVELEQLRGKAPAPLPSGALTGVVALSDEKIFVAIDKAARSKAARAASVLPVSEGADDDIYETETED